MCYGRDDDDDWPHVPDGLGRLVALVVVFEVLTFFWAVAVGG